MKKTKVIAGFPCVGKSYLTKHHSGYYTKKADDEKLTAYEYNELTILDSDSMSFSWLWDNKGQKLGRNPHFPENYLNYIKSHLGKADIILVSTHPVVIDELLKNDIVFTYVRPEYGLLGEYIKRMKNRGNDSEFINNIIKIWSNDVGHDELCDWDFVELGSGQFLNMDLISTFRSFDEHR